MRSERNFASLEWDSGNALHWRPRGEHGTEAWGRYLGARWLRFAVVAQRWFAR